MPTPWIFFILIAAWMVHACLRVITREYATAIAWHDLRVRVQRLRREHQRRLEESTETEPSLRRIFGKKTEVPSLLQPTDAVADAVQVLEAVAA